MFIGSIALFLAGILLFAGFLTSSSLVMAQQQTTTAPEISTTPLLPPPSVTTGQPTSSIPATPLTPQEQEQQNRLQNVIAATNLNLDETEKQIGGVVYTPRWSAPVWVEPDSASVLVAYCLPGEFAESGQEILGGFELEVLESYEVALPQNFMAWMMVIGNEDRQDRLPAAVGVVCASDANDAETRVLSPEEQQQINNVVQQITQVTSIDQVINIINNATTPTSPPPTTTTTPQPGGGAGRSINASLSANPTIYNGSCPAFIEFSGTIYDNVGNRDIRYRFIRSDGATGQEQVIHFNQPGSQTVSTSWTLGDINALPSYQGWVAIEILQPIQLQSNRAEFEMYCAPTTGGAPPGGSSSSGIGGITISDLHIDFLTASGPVASDTNTYNGPCPVGASISGTITDNIGNRDVTYRLIMNDGVLPEGVRHFDQPGSERVSFGIQTLGGFNNVQSYQGWFAIEILQPVQVQSEVVEFQTICTPSTGGTPPAPQTLQAENDTTTAGTTTTDEEEEEEEETTTDGGEAGGGTEGGGTGDTDNGDQSPPAETTTTDGGEAGGGTEGGTGSEPPSE